MMCTINKLTIIVILGYNFASAQPPNIVVIIADDLGWLDVNFHGGDEIPTPNIDALAYYGVTLNSHYTQPVGTSSRSAFLTGMQHSGISASEPRGLSLNEKLRNHGYSIYSMGDWDLRSNDAKEFLDINAVGNDLHRNMDVDWDNSGKHVMECYTSQAEKLIAGHDTSDLMFMCLAYTAPHASKPHDPVQAPDEDTAKLPHIRDRNRRAYSAMICQLDKAVGRVVDALRKKKMLNNSVIVVMSGNGAPINYGSNFPLRGVKGSVWEGSTRGVAAVWSPLIEKPQRVSNHLMHVTDWFPTILHAAGLNASGLKNIDGLNMWNSISKDSPSPRTKLVYNIGNCSSVRNGDWKYITGSCGVHNSWYGSSNQDKNRSYDANTVITSKAGSAFAEISPRISNETIATLRNQATVKCNLTNIAKCDRAESEFLFNITDDPCEMKNLAKDKPEIVQQLKKLLLKVNETAVPATNVASDPKTDAKN